MAQLKVVIAKLRHDRFGASSERGGLLDAKFAQHQPLNRQSEVYAREGIDLDVSTLADWVGACAATLAPLVTLIRSHVLAAERIHGERRHHRAGAGERQSDHRPLVDLRS